MAYMSKYELSNVTKIQNKNKKYKKKIQKKIQKKNKVFHHTLFFYINITFT